MLSVMVFNNLRIIKETNYTRISTQASLIMELFSRSIARNLVEEYLIQENTEIVGQEAEIAYAAVEDANGRIIAHTDRTLLGEFLNIKEEKTLKDVTDGIYDVSKPVMLFERYLGRVRIGFSTVQLNKDIANARNQGVIIACIQLFLGILVALLLGWYLTRHLEKFTAVAKSIAGGDLSQRITFAVKSMGRGDLSQRVTFTINDELNVLAQAFNDMAIKLEQLYQDLDEKIKELKGLDTLKDDFLNAASHDLSTPIATIMGYISILERKEIGELNESQKKFANAIKNACKYLAFLVENLLTTARIEAKREVERKFSFPLSNLLKEVNELFTPQIEEKQIKFIINLQEDFLIEGDRGALKQVFANLISNAIKFTQLGGEVKVDVLDYGPKVKILIADTGKGISQEKLPFLFNKFIKYGDEKGLGLGLYIVKKILEAHESEILVESTELKGTTATFTLKKSSEETSEL